MTPPAAGDCGLIRDAWSWRRFVPRRRVVAVGTEHSGSPANVRSMSPLDTIEPAFDALDTCVGAIGMLDMTCSDPERGEQLTALGETITETRMKLRVVTISSESTGPAAREILEEAGAQVGRLQVGCCDLDRMHLYAEILENLTKARMALERVLADAD